MTALLIGCCYFFERNDSNENKPNNSNRPPPYERQGRTHLAGLWLSDYVDNRLGGFEPEQNKGEKLKPDCALIGCDFNIFNLMGIASRTLKQNGMAPFIPHFYALILDDSNKEERNLGMLAGLSMLWVCDAVWVFGDELT